MRTEVRAVGDDGFEEVYPLLALFPSPRMSREDWRRMLFGYSWPGAGPIRGYALHVDGKVAGFYGTLFSRRTLRGREGRFCNAACWMMHPDYRSKGLGRFLIDAVAGIRDCTVTHLTPSPTTYAVWERRGCRRLESEVLLLPPPVDPLQVARALRGSSTAAPEVLERELQGEEAAIYRDLRDAPVAQHLLLRRDGRRCYLVVTPGRRKGFRVAALRYIGDLDFFWEHRMLAHAALLRSMGTMILEVDGRHAAGRRVGPALRRPAGRSYSTDRADLTPDLVDGLYSEWMGLRE